MQHGRWVFGGGRVHYQLAQSHANSGDGGGSSPQYMLHSARCLPPVGLPASSSWKRSTGRPDTPPHQPPRPKSLIRPNKKQHCSSLSCLHRCRFPAGGVLSAFLKVKSLHVSDPLISLSGGCCGGFSNVHSIHFLLLVSGDPDSAVAIGIGSLKPH